MAAPPKMIVCSGRTVELEAGMLGLVLLFGGKSFCRRQLADELRLGHGMAPGLGGLFCLTSLCHDHLFKLFSFAELSAHCP